ncbi:MULTISPECIES: hypothetical protein [unclassified Lysobacter]|uniref:hypothetical protein n=1 Tax=unclassified Lysobacter TaxID=2635362 RepID=UPI001BEAB45C|nr:MULTISPECIES: hypothetical protein [unclassified Lysobacter]MBT2746127.1 hypothetical protein [Lysobacter sp. ISL-42]MBT2752562.1 hypothetical protein [Lysobacter sp. ISL-50]MBT2776709.1 hypothetical protein [Lysobacter sp. ISL-54]MBT2780723.1 hypothetical protein [Lysobacter sp. ISL-52]
MRNDMYKVIVERPRLGGGWDKPGREARDPEDQRVHESLRLRHGYRKSLNENLRPLQRYLERQVGRRWDLVYSQLCARVDRRNTVQQHIHQHIDDFVAMQVLEIDGEFHVMRSWGGLAPLAEVRSALYVDPRNGCLMRNEAAIGLRGERRRAHRMAVRARREGWQDEVRTLDAHTQLRRIDGLWYEVALAPVPARDTPRKPDQRRRKLPRQIVFDAVTHKKIGPCDGERCRTYGACALYARRKRQLSGAELSDHGLRNGTAPDSYAASPRSGGRAPHASKYRAPIRNGARNKEH